MVLGSKKREISLLKQNIAKLEAENDRLRKTIKDAGIEDNEHFNLSVLSKILELNGIGFFIKKPESEDYWFSSLAREIL
jgi:hypothetical protein